jgi:hypothetical protein
VGKGKASAVKITLATPEDLAALFGPGATSNRTLPVSPRLAKEALDVAVAGATELVQAGEMEVRLYNAHLIYFANEYAKLGHGASALNLLSAVSADYARNHYSEDAATNDGLAVAGGELASWLVARGYVEKTVAEAPVQVYREVGRA